MSQSSILDLAKFPSPASSNLEYHQGRIKLHRSSDALDLQIVSQLKSERLLGATRAKALGYAAIFVLLGRLCALPVTMADPSKGLPILGGLIAIASLLGLAWLALLDQSSSELACREQTWRLRSYAPEKSSKERQLAPRSMDELDLAWFQEANFPGEEMDKGLLFLQTQAEEKYLLAEGLAVDEMQWLTLVLNQFIQDCSRR